MVSLIKTGVGILVIAAALLLITIEPVSAFGISPAGYNEFFKSDTAYIYSFWIVNSDKQNFTVSISADGELSKYITLLNHSISLTDADDFKKAFFKISYPESLGEPGQHSAYLIFTQDDKTPEAERDSRQDNVRVIPVVKAMFNAFVPYPGLYLDSNMSIESLNPRQPVSLIFPLSNRGLIDIDSIYADIRVYDNGGAQIIDARTDEISLQSKKQVDLRKKFGDELKHGSYKCSAILYYDGNSVNFNRDFDYGSWMVSIQDIRVDDFKIGGFADFNITLSNNWNQDAVGTVADMIITSKTGYHYESVTSVETIPAHGSAQFSAYWDTSDAIAEDYFITLRIYYGQNVQQYSETFTVEENRIITRYYTPPEKVYETWYKKHKEDISYWAFPAILLILAMLVFFILIQFLPLLDAIIARMKKIILIPVRCVSRVISYIAGLSFFDNYKRKRRIRELQKRKNLCIKSIRSIKDDLVIMKKAVEGLYHELEKGIINKSEFNNRLNTILEGKTLEYLEDYYVSVIVQLEEKIKQINKKIWEEG